MVQHGAGNTVVANIHLDMLQVFLFHTLMVLNRKKCYFNRTVLQSTVWMLAGIQCTHRDLVGYV